MLFSNVKTTDERLKNTFAITANYTELYTDFSAPVNAEKSEEDGYTITANDGGYTISYKRIYDFYAGYVYLCANADKITQITRKRVISQFGIMPAISAGGVPKIEEMKRFVVQLACMGYNFMELSLDDCMEISEEPYYGYLRGRYTKVELKELVAFAAQYDMEIIPSVQTLGHFELVLQHPVYNKVKEAPAVLLCKEEETYQLIENIIKTCRECFTTEHINICFDEAHEIGLGAYLKKHGFENRVDIMLGHLSRVKEICKKYAFKPAIYSDMFFTLEFGKPYAPDGVFSEETISKIPQDVDLIYWDYYRPAEFFYEQVVKQHKQLTTTDRLQYLGAVWTWNGFAPLIGWSEISMLSALEVCKRHKIGRFMVAAWGDDGSECSFNQAFSVYALLAESNYKELAESGQEAVSLEEYKRIIDENGSIRDIKGLHNATLNKVDKESVSRVVQILSGYTLDEWRLMEAPNNLFGDRYPSTGNPSKYFLYQDVLLGRFDSYVSEKDKEKYQTAYTKLSELAKRKRHYAYLFDLVAKLSKVLYLKADIGVKLRNAYKNGDKKALLAHARTLRKTAKAVQEFYEIVVTLWEKERKMVGFELQDARLGGLQTRLLHAAKRVENYVKGKISEIEELKEEILYYNPHDSEGNFESKRALINQGWYRTISTVNTR